jgi:hypothetical protein
MKMLMLPKILSLLYKMNLMEFHGMDEACSFGKTLQHRSKPCFELRTL